MGHRINIAGRIGGWSARNWKTALSIWFGVIAVLFCTGHFTGTSTLTDSQQVAGQAGTAERMLARAHFSTPPQEAVYIHSDRLRIHNAQFHSVVASTLSFIRSQRSASHILSPNTHPGLIGDGGHSVLVQFQLPTGSEHTGTAAIPFLKAVERLSRRSRGFEIGEFGDASANYEVNATVNADFKRAEQLSLPVTLLILIITFGALIAAGLPIILAFSAVLGAIGLSALLSHLMPSTSSTASIILLIGMAVGVDYSLFYLRRDREERALGKGKQEALRATAHTSGQAVMISGLTVLVAMAGMLFAGNPVFTSLGIGAMLAVFISVLGSLTALPALLSTLGRWVDKGRLPLLGRRKRRPHGHVWAILLRPVLKYPLVAVCASVAVLLLASLPALGMKISIPGYSSLPRNIPAMRTFDAIQRDFPGAPAPAEVVVEVPNVASHRLREALAAFSDQLKRSGNVGHVAGIRYSANHHVVAISIPLAGGGQDATSYRALNTLRQTVIPSTLGKVRRAKVAVTGETAFSKDFNDSVRSRMPYVVGFVLALAFLLMLVSFRSLIIPLKTIGLNLLSVGASYGIITLVFQDGVGAHMLGFTTDGAIVSYLPLFLFVILFGLSMDYHVFILSRVKELVDRGLHTDAAVGKAIAGTAGTVTSAALVMVMVFSIFATLHTIDMQQLGFGLAVAVLIDATIIRGILLPSAMKLLGPWNWYLPSWLNWLPHVHLGE